MKKILVLFLSFLFFSLGCARKIVGPDSLDSTEKVERNVIIAALQTSSSPTSVEITVEGLCDNVDIYCTINHTDTLRINKEVPPKVFRQTVEILSSVNSVIFLSSSKIHYKGEEISPIFIDL